MFTHHELMMLQNTERRLELATQARRGGLVAALRRATRTGRRATPATQQVPTRAPSHTPARAPSDTPARAPDPAPAGGDREKPAANGRPAGTLTACAASGGQTR